MSDAKDVPMCACGDAWHEHNAANHDPTCRVLGAYDTLTRERDEARVDVERLDWLVSRTSFLVHQWQGGGYTLTLPQPPVDGVRPSPLGFSRGTLREAIDAARTADAGCLGAPFCSKGCCAPQSAATRKVVTDAMVERACEAYVTAVAVMHDAGGKIDGTNRPQAMRAALTAALSEATP
jgi:hypothetical protein